jgi:N-acetylglucosaminyl-diphospho-decaprenol L-rhamnosyltransferase
MPQSRFAVSVIIVSYNSAHCIGKVLQSVMNARERIVVDNASADGSADIAAPYATRVIASAENRGFGAACNVGAAHATEDLLLFLNPDAVMRPGALERLVQCARDHPQAVAFGARVALPDAERRSTPLPATEPVPAASVRDVDNITGAALLCRTAVFREIGGFDEGFFLYFEDEDLCRRLRRHGPLLIDDGAIYVHLPGTGVKLDARRP